MKVNFCYGNHTFKNFDTLQEAIDWSVLDNLEHFQDIEMISVHRPSPGKDGVVLHVDYPEPPQVWMRRIKEWLGTFEEEVACQT